MREVWYLAQCSYASDDMRGKKVMKILARNYARGFSSETNSLYEYGVGDVSSAKASVHDIFSVDRYKQLGEVVAFSFGEIRESKKVKNGV